jgi:hypothetical protein
MKRIAWEWLGAPGHLMALEIPEWHLATRVGRYLVSTVQRHNAYYTYVFDLRGVMQPLQLPLLPPRAWSWNLCAYLDEVAKWDAMPEWRHLQTCRRYEALQRRRKRSRKGR